MRAGLETALPLVKDVVEWQQRSSATSLQRAGSITFVGEVVPERAEQERSEAPALAVEVVQVVFFKHPHEEALRQIFCFFLCVPEPAYVRIDRRPVRVAERRECFARLTSGFTARCLDQRDASGWKRRAPRVIRHLARL